MDKEQAKKFVAKRLGFKSYTCQEIFRKLVHSGCDEAIAEEVISEFCKAGIINDEEYAKMYIHDALVVGLKGMFRIKQELLAKGISQKIVEKAASLLEEDQDEYLEKYVLMRFGDTVFTDLKELEKAKAHLMRRGFGIYDINSCFKKLKIGVSGGKED